MKDLEQRKYEITFEKVARDLQKIRDAAMEDGCTVRQYRRSWDGQSLLG